MPESPRSFAELRLPSDSDVPADAHRVGIRLGAAIWQNSVTRERAMR
jgi:hypothetical protein